MSPRSRFNLILLLGIPFGLLILHDLYSFEARMRAGEASLLSLLPVGPVLLIGAALVGVVVVVGLAAAVNRFLSSQTGRGGPGQTLVALVALAIFGAGVFLVWSYPRGVRPQEWSGLVAAALGVALILLAFPLPRRLFTVGQLALLAATIVAFAFPSIHPGHREKSSQFRRLMQATLEELERKRESWEGLDHRAVATEAAARAERDLVYRFDERLDEIRELDAPKIDPEAGVLLDLPRDGVFVSSGPPLEYEVSGGTQVFPRYPGGTLLGTEDPLGLDASNVGSFQITLKISAGSYFQVFWGEEENVNRAHHGLRIPLGPPGESASYEIKERIIGDRGTSRFNHVWIIPSDRDARVEIESFRILDRTSAVLQGVPFEAGYENVNEEIRRALFVATPSDITYAVNVPARGARLLFGLAPSGATPVEFEVIVRHQGRETGVFSEEIPGEPRWSDRELDLSRWGGEKVDVTFRTRADTRTLGLWSNPVLVGEPSPDPNVVIFLVDCLRADHLGAYGYERETSRVFDELAKQGTLFERMFSNGTTTKHSIPSLFSSHPISSTGVRLEPDVLPQEFPTLAEILRERGYATAAFATNPNVGPYSGTHQGFSQLFNPIRIAREGGSEETPPDAEILFGDLLQEWVRDHADRNFLLYVHTMDAHGPYDPPAEYRHFYEAETSRTPVTWDRLYDPPGFDKPTRESRTALYDGEIAYGDVYLGRFLELLEEQGVRENTIFVFTADHGEYFGEHGMWGHNPPPFVQGTNIPLLIVGPGFPAGARVTETTQVMDILPTILDALGIDPSLGHFQGASLLPLAQGRAAGAFAERAIFIEGRFPGQAAFHAGRFHVLPEKNLVFDLEADPEENRYLSTFSLDFSLKSFARRVTSEYLETYAQLHGLIAPAGGSTLGVDEETLKQLRALGYID